MNTLSLGCSTTKAHTEQRHFHHVSHSSWLTGTVKSSLIPWLCAGELTRCQQQLHPWLPGMVAVLRGSSTNRSPLPCGHSLRDSRAMGGTVFPHAQVTPAQGWRDGQSWMRRCSKMSLTQAVGAIPCSEQVHGVIHPSYHSGFRDLLGVNTQQL